MTSVPQVIRLLQVNIALFHLQLQEHNVVIAFWLRAPLSVLGSAESHEGRPGQPVTQRSRSVDPTIYDVLAQREMEP